MFDRLAEQNFAGYKKPTTDTVQALSCGPMVYVRNLKCGSTFFYNSFLQNFNWCPVPWESIDWQNQHVFGHMINPLERRHKSVAEFLIMNKLQDIIFESVGLQNFFQHAPLFDEHTSSYFDTFGNRCYHIDWIPISGKTNAETVNLTEKLMYKYGMRKFDWDYSNTHSSSPEKKELENKLVRLYNEKPAPEWAQRYLDRDNRLWYTVLDKFNALGEHWDNCSWLRTVK
jgi:hypothetical protein